MEHFTLSPLMPAENSFPAGGETMTNLQTSQQQQQHQQRQQQLMYESSQIGTTTNTNPNINLKSEYTEFTNCIQQSALLDQRAGSIDINMDSVSLGTFCDELKYGDSPTETNNNNNCTINEQQQQQPQQHHHNHNVVITNVRNLTSQNFKQLTTTELNNKLTTTTTTTTKTSSASAPNCNNSSDLNAEEVSAVATFNDCSLFFGNHDDLHHSHHHQQQQQHHHHHHHHHQLQQQQQQQQHIDLVTPKAVLESVQTHLPQYFNLNKINNNNNNHNNNDNNNSESADVIYQQLPNNITTTTTNSNNNNHHHHQQQQQQQQNHHYDQQQQPQQQTSQKQQQQKLITTNISCKENNNNLNITASIPIFAMNVNDSAEASTYTNTHSQQQQNYQHLNHQQQQQQEEQEQEQPNNQRKRKNKKKLNTKSASTATTITALKDDSTNLNCLEEKQFLQRNCHNLSQEDNTLTNITTSSARVPKLTATTSQSLAATTTKTVVSQSSVQNDVILYNTTNNKFLNTCNNNNNNNKNRKCKNNINNNNYQDESSNSDESDSFCDSEEYPELEKGYQDNTSSHSQQSAGANSVGGNTGNTPGSSANNNNNIVNSAGVSLLNGVVNAGGGGGGGNGPGNNPNTGSAAAVAVAAAGGYMSLLPHGVGVGTAATSSGHMGGTSVGGGVNTNTGGGPTGEGIDFKHLFEELCPVCGDKVSGYHYGLLTCESCKGFFKRTVQNKKVYTCVAERSCHIDKTQRKRCPYCRFQKCLEVGMKLEAVRADRMRGGRNKFGPMYKRDRARKLQMMRQRQLALQALRTSIGSADIKATPLSPGYQQAYPNINIKQEIQIPQVSSLTQSPDSSPSPIAIALGQVNTSSGGGVITTPMNGGNGSAGNGNAGGGNGSNGNGNNHSDGINRSGSGNCHDPNTATMQNSTESKLCFDSSTHPSSTADAIIEPLRVSPMIRDFVQSIDDREWQTQLFALLQKQTYNQVEVDLFELMCKVLDQNLFSQVDWARNTVFFKDLKVDDQMKLLQHSWSDMLVLDHLHQRIHNGLPDETHLNNGQVFNLLYLGLLGVPQLADYFNELQNKLQDLKFDMGDYVCMKFLILLNPDVRGIINKKTVVEGHENVQAALLDYTLTCYPSVTDKFRRLLNILPDIHAMASRGEEHLYSKHCAGSAPTQTLLMEMLHAKRKV